MRQNMKTQIGLNILIPTILWKILCVRERIKEENLFLCLHTHHRMLKHGTHISSSPPYHHIFSSCARGGAARKVFFLSQHKYGILLICECMLVILEIWFLVNLINLCYATELNPALLTHTHSISDVTLLQHFLMRNAMRLLYSIYCYCCCDDDQIGELTQNCSQWVQKCDFSAFFATD